MLLEKQWNDAVKSFEMMQFPDKRMEALTLETQNTNIGENHKHNGEIHTLHTYRIFERMGVIPVEWKYNFCPICRKVRTKVGVLIHPDESRCYRKYFIRKGVDMSKIKENETIDAYSLFTEGGDF